MRLISGCQGLSEGPVGDVDPLQLLVRAGEVLQEAPILEAQVLVAAVPVIEPGLAGVHEPARIAERAEGPGQGGRALVDHPEGGAGVVHAGGLNAGQNVELRVDGAGSEVGHDDVPRQGLTGFPDAVPEGQGILPLGIVEDGQIEKIREGLALDEYQVRGRRLGTLPRRVVPGLGLGAVVALGRRNVVEPIVVQEAVEEAGLVEDCRDVVALQPGHGFGRLVIDVVGGIDREHGAREQTGQDQPRGDPQPGPEPGLELEAQQEQDQGDPQEHEEIGDMQVELIVPGGDDGFPQEAEIRRDQGILPALHLDQIDQGEQAQKQGARGARPEEIAQQGGQDPQQDQDREQIEDQQLRRVQEVLQGLEHGAGLESRADHQNEAAEREPEQGRPERGQLDLLCKQSLHVRFTFSIRCYSIQYGVTAFNPA